MNFSDFFGLGSLPERLKADFSDDRHVNAYLLVGPAGTGKSEMAAVCARALNCEGALKPCDVCSPCARALAGTHPDIIELRSAEQKNTIAVDDVRALIARVMVRPFEGGHHAVIVHGADEMTTQAQNALLKTLESGPDSAVFFLIAEQLSKLLTTILSRCRIVRFHTVDEQVCAEVLIGRGIEEGRAQLLARASGGAIGRALALHDDDEYWSLRDRIIGSLLGLNAPGGRAAAMGALKDEKDHAVDALGIFEEIGRALMVSGESSVPLEPELGALTVGGSNLLHAAIHARQRLASNVVWINVIENLFLEIGR